MEALNLNEPLDAAVNACLKVAFWLMLRLSELTVKNIKTFDPALHVKPVNVTLGQDQGSNEVMVIFIFRTKAAANGKDLYFAHQQDECDLIAALRNYFKINKLCQNRHLFKYKHNSNY